MQYRQTLDFDTVVQSVQLIHMNPSPMNMQHPSPLSWTSTHFPCTCFCFSHLLCTHSQTQTPIHIPHASFSNICILKWKQSWHNGKPYSQTVKEQYIILPSPCLAIISGNANSHNHGNGKNVVLYTLQISWEVSLENNVLYSTQS